MLYIFNKLNDIKNQSLGNTGILVCPTTPTACCLLKQASINSLLFSAFKFLKFVRLAPYCVKV